MPRTSRTRRLAAITRSPHPAPSCPEGHHPALLATTPRRSAESVEVDWVCTECGQIVRTESFRRDYWDTRHP